MNQLSAPIIDRYIHMLSYSQNNFDDNSWNLINELFDLINNIKPCGEDNRHELWITVPKGDISDFGDYEEYLQEEIVKTQEEFEKMWNDEYPEDVYWYKLNTMSFKRTNPDDEFKAIFLNNKLIVQTPSVETRGFEIDISELIHFLILKVKECIDKLKNNTYNELVNNELPYECRYGTISRKAYWEIFNEQKSDYLKDISKQEITELQEYINTQESLQKQEQNNFKTSKDIGRISELTANMFYYYCSLGYKANNYEDCDTLSPKELYYKNADGRDDGLKNIDGDSPSEFNNWYNDKTKCGGHPWEVCRGGNSTHVSLYVFHDEYGYYLVADGKSYGRSIETIKLYLALKKENIPVYLRYGKELLNRVLALDNIGIVPHFVTPFYCESDFPDEVILDFTHLRLDSNKQILKHINWKEIQKQYLN